MYVNMREKERERQIEVCVCVCVCVLVRVSVCVYLDDELISLHPPWGQLALLGI